MILSPCGTIQGYWNKWFKRNITWLKIPTGWRQTSWLFTSVTEDLNSGLPRTNPESDQGGSWTRGLRITFNSLYSGHCIRRGLEFVSSLARVRNSGSLFQWNVCNFLFCRGFSYCPFYRAVSYSGVSASRELTVQVQPPNQSITPPP